MGGHGPTATASIIAWDCDFTTLSNRLLLALKAVLAMREVKTQAALLIVIN